MIHAGISAFAVLPENQNCGIGKALLTRIMDEAKGRRLNAALAGTQGNLLTPQNSVSQTYSAEL